MSGRLVHYFPRIWPGGGPPGYLYNLRSALSEHFPDAPVEVVTLMERHDRYSYVGEHIGRRSGAIRGLVRRYAPASWKRRRAYSRYLRVWHTETIPASARGRLAKAAAIVFHDPRSAWWYFRDGGGGTSQRVYVELHAPVDVATEDAADLTAHYGESTLWDNLADGIAEVELGTYERAHGIIVPCPGAVDSYFSCRADLKSRFTRLTFHHVLPGAPRMHASTTREAVRRRLGAADDELLVGFFGRYHRHKGFDVFCDVAALAHHRGRRSLRFLSAGDGWIRPPALPNYTNLGWLGLDLADVLNAVDCLLQPNRHTFLDLMFIEAMSVGKPIVTTAIGGGRWLASVAKGVLAVEPDPQRLLDAVESALPEARRVELGRANRDTYHAVFTLRAFAERHIAFAKAVLDGA